MISTLDLGFRDLPKAAAAFLVKTQKEHVLIECGPALCHDALASELERHGSSPDQIKHVFLTHIHLDHAGGCGAFARLGARIHVHPKGAPHLIDPSRLNSSARRVFGPALDRDLGELEISPEALVNPVQNGATVDLGDVRFTAVETTGHASHHHSWVVSSNEGRHVFTGDAAGMRLPNTRFPTLPMVPPEFNLEQWLNSIRIIQSLEADSMWMTHFDEIDDHFDYLEKAYQRVVEETRFICTLANTDDDEAISHYQAWQITMAENEGIQSSLVKRYCDRTHYTANLTGVRRWLSKGGQLP